MRGKAAEVASKTGSEKEIANTTAARGKLIPCFGVPGSATKCLRRKLGIHGGTS